MTVFDIALGVAGGLVIYNLVAGVTLLLFSVMTSLYANLRSEKDGN